MGDSLPVVTGYRVIPLQETREGAELDTARNHYTLVQVYTDAGLTGMGSCYTSTDLVRAALARLEHLFLGEIAIEPERVHEKLEQHSFWWGRGGTITHAISGIDIALWDIFGQATGQPVSRLLGGVYRDRVKPYASVGFSEPSKLRDLLQQTMDKGFKAFKLGWGGFALTNEPAYDELLVKTARDTVGDLEIMVDAGGSHQYWPHSYKWALRYADMLSDYDVVWFEEPLPPDDIEGYKLLREHARVMISSGEVRVRRQDFTPWLEQGVCDIIQPDCTKCGGITAARYVAWTAYQHNILTVPHGWNTAVGLVADLHLIASIPIGKWVEYHQPSEVVDDLVARPFELDEDGMLPVPTGPGLDIDLNWEAMERLSRGTIKRGCE